MKQIVVALAFVCALGATGCEDEISGVPNANRTPETHLARPTVNTVQSSRVHVHWYGDDPDGLVAGYVFSWNRRDWYFTDRNDSLFSLQIATNDSTYTFSIAAVDNSVAASRLPAGNAAVAFTDTDGNGLYTDGEAFAGLEGATDPTPATVTYRIQNSPPVVVFGADSTAVSRGVRQNPDTTFTVASFLFSVYDTDGEESVVAVEWSLNDSSSQAQWTRIAPTQTLLTLRASDGLRLDDTNVLYLRAVDNGGMTSAVARYPAEGGTWYVRRPKGDILLIKDYGTANADNFYTQTLNTIAGGKFANAYDVLDIRVGSSPTTRPDNLPLFISPTFIETLKLFRAVIWYGDNRPDLALAQQALPEYNRAGGKVLFATALPTSVESTGALVDFAPVDSVSSSELPGFPQALRNGSVVAREPGAPALYPDLVKATGNVAGVHTLYPRVTATALYRLPENEAYPGRPIVGVRSSAGDMVFINLPLHLFTGDNSAQQLVERVLTTEFGL